MSKGSEDSTRGFTTRTTGFREPDRAGQLPSAGEICTISAARDSDSLVHRCTIASLRAPSLGGGFRRLVLQLTEWTPETAQDPEFPEARWTRTGWRFSEIEMMGVCRSPIDFKVHHQRKVVAGFTPQGMRQPRRIDVLGVEDHGHLRIQLTTVQDIIQSARQKSA